MRKRMLSVLLCLVMVMSLLPTAAFAAEDGTPAAGKTIYVDATNGDDGQADVGTTSEKAYKTVSAAVAAAASGDTIQLGEGNYTLYGISSKGHTEGKNLTFIGQGVEKTGWNIGAEVPDPANFGTEYNGDYSFDGAGTITFQNMTLRSGSADYLGFIRADNTIVKNCAINGKTFYWGYTSATFTDTTFNCPAGDYALWTYSSPTMTFDNCVFNSSGKVINVYTDYDAGKHDITVNFKDCTVTNTGNSQKPVLNINDRNMGDYKYILNISGSSTVNGVDVDQATCSRLFGFGGKAGTNNTGCTVVSFGDTTVWKDGKMVDAKAYHNSGVTAEGVSYANGVEGSNDSLYAEGYKDNAFDVAKGDWQTHEDGTITRSVTKTCRYCGYKEEYQEVQSKLIYEANGGTGTMDPAVGVEGSDVTVAQNGFTRSGYTFTGWNTKADGTGDAYKEGQAFTLGTSMVLYAQWSKNHSDHDSTTYYYFAIEKIDAQDSHTLNGAKFGLYLDGKQIATATSNRSGIAVFRVAESDYRKITSKSDIYYQELTAPEGYVMNSDKVSIEKSDLSANQTTAEKNAETVRNYRSSTPDLLNDSDHFAYVIGYKDGLVKPYGLITRAETTTIFFRLLKDSVRDGNLKTGNTYTDVADSYWANTAISTMTGLGIVQGRSETTFDPTAPITRAQFAAICARFDTGTANGTQTFSDISGHWAEKYIQRAAELGWIKGFEDGTFRPDTYITRAQAMTMINRVLNRIPEDTGDLLNGMNVWPDCNPGDWFYLAVQEATNSHDFKHKAGNYETWTKLNTAPDWTRYEN